MRICFKCNAINSLQNGTSNTFFAKVFSICTGQIVCMEKYLSNNWTLFMILLGANTLNTLSFLYLKYVGVWKTKHRN